MRGNTTASDRAKPHAESQDPDTAAVVEALRGATVGPNDPDVKLAQMLPQLKEGTNSAFSEALERLVRNASADRG